MDYYNACLQKDVEFKWSYSNKFQVEDKKKEEGAEYFVKLEQNLHFLEYTAARMEKLSNCPLGTHKIPVFLSGVGP